MEQFDWSVSRERLHTVLRSRIVQEVYHRDVVSSTLKQDSCNTRKRLLHHHAKTKLLLHRYANERPNVASAIAVLFAWTSVRQHKDEFK